MKMLPCCNQDWKL